MRSWPGNQNVYSVVVYHVPASLVAQSVKNLPEMRETGVRSLGWQDSLEKGNTLIKINKNRSMKPEVLDLGPYLIAIRVLTEAPHSNNLFNITNCGHMNNHTNKKTTLY